MNLKTSIVIIVAVFLGGFICGHYNKRCSTNPISAAATVSTNTAISVEPKKANDKSVLDARIKPTKLFVRINGIEKEIETKTKESYPLEKNKIVLEQESTAKIEIETNQIDNTKKWGIGVSYGLNGIGGIFMFPVISSLGGFTYADKKSLSAGLIVRL